MANVNEGDYPYGLDEEGIESIQAVADSDLPAAWLAEEVLELVENEE